jgi:hypothetical protein
MKNVNDEEIKALIEQLDTSVPRDDSKLVVYYDDDSSCYCSVEGNRNGYLRAAIEFLRAATAPLESGNFITPVDLNYLVPRERGILVRKLLGEMTS